MTTKKLCALLPLKAHSARVPGKNFKSFANKPLFKWILDTLLSIDVISKIVINTDAVDLLKKNGLVENAKIQLRVRPPEICGDEISMNRVIENDLEEIQSDAYLMTHTTNPLLTADTIKKATASYFKGIEKGSNDSLFSVNKFQTRFYKKNGKPINHDPENLVRTQDLEPYYEENSNLYIFNRDSFYKTGARIGAAPILFETPHLDSFDIDDQDGWNLAEIIALYRQLADVGKN
ncbi:acylneuraminate cytidylyltransferase family protein [Verrucomicrobia bacterium]|nr:acylneuraminate cytidylyltransferase family protein [Verrucomicrobiota bacterium]MDC0324081.1 acylneuraminate cytidylyltransferase family protein [Verrucomicrobiota bacterium]